MLLLSGITSYVCYTMWPLPVLGMGRRSRLRQLCLPYSRLAVQFVSGVLAVWTLLCVPLHPMP